MTGIDASRIISQYFEIPIIYMTALSNDDSLLEARSRESYGFLFKPFRPNELNIAIEMALINRDSKRTALFRTNENYITIQYKDQFPFSGFLRPSPFSSNMIFDR